MAKHDDEQLHALAEAYAAEWVAARSWLTNGGSEVALRAVKAGYLEGFRTADSKTEGAEEN